MNKKLLSIAFSVAIASFFFACKSGINSSDAVSLINGPNSIKGTISGTMMNDTAYSFNYDYHYTTNDGNSATESWIEDGGTYDGQQVCEVWQYFYYDRGGYDDYGDTWSTSGNYFYFYFYFNGKTMEQMPTDYSSYQCEGMWSNITPKGNRFVYRMEYYSNNTNAGTMAVTGLSYNSTTEILSGKFNLSMPEGNGNWHYQGNTHATTITGDFKVYFPKDNFKVTKKGTYYGQVFRKRTK